MSETKFGGKPLFNPERVFLIGDVHNEADKLMSLLDQIEPLVQPNDHIVFCGDLVDRGTQPALMIEELVGLCKKFPNQIVFVEGNHDWMLRNYLETGNTEWFTYLLVTLNGLKEAWGLENIWPETIAQGLIDHGWKEVTSRTVPYYETPEVIATHAPMDKMIMGMFGIKTYAQEYKDHGNDPGFVHILDRVRDALLWQFTEENVVIPEIDKFRVCGHQPGSHKAPRIFKDRAFIDTGCGKGTRPVTCLIYPGKKYYQSQ